MSQENVEVARDAIAAVNRGDINAVLEYYDPSIEWFAPSEAIDDDVYTGYEGVREVWSAWMEQFDELHIDVERVVDFADDRVLVLGYQRGLIKGTLVQPTRLGRSSPTVQSPRRLAAVLLRPLYQQLLGP